MRSRVVDVFLDGMLHHTQKLALSDKPSQEWLRKVRQWVYRRFRPHRWVHCEVWIDGDPVLDWIA